jgi:hypothetical protein
MKATSLAALPPAELGVEARLFEAFCDRCGRNPLDWSTRTRRQYRKAIRHCRKCHLAGAR